MMKIINDLEELFKNYKEIKEENIVLKNDNTSLKYALERSKSNYIDLVTDLKKANSENAMLKRGMATPKHKPNT